MKKIKFEDGVLRLDVVDEIGLVILEFGDEIEVDFASKNLEEVDRRFKELKRVFLS